MRFRYFLLSSLCCFAVTLTLAAPAIAQSQQAAAAIRSACPSDFRSLCAGVKTGGQEALACLQKNASRLSAACRTAVEAAAPPPAAPAQAEPAPKASPAPAPAPVATPAPAPTQAAPAPAPAPQAPAASTPPSAPVSEKAATPAKPAPPAAPVTKQATPPAQPKAPVVKQASPPAKPAEPLVVTPPAQPQPPTVAAPSAVEQAVLVKQCGLEIQVHCREIPAGDGRVLACLMQNESKLRPRCRVALKAVSN